MLMRCHNVTVFSVCLMLVGVGTLTAQDYPNKPVRIVTAAPGGSIDFTARLIAQGLAGALGQQVVVENRVGGVLPGDLVSKAPPDGYTLMVHGSGHWLAPYMQDKVPYDPVRDFAPITQPVSLPHMIVVHPSLPVKSIKDLIALAKARPGALNDASTGIGSATYVAAQLFKSMAGINMVSVAYKGSAPALSALLSGEVQVMFAATAAGTPLVKARRLKALAVTSAAPTALAPDLPTVAASGLPGFEATSIYGMFAPAKTPANIINRLNQETVRALNRPDTKEKFFNAGADVVAGTPEQLAAAIKSEMTVLGKVIRDLGIRTE
jgi:tripartite-type tricarboxylate transporter receptor subunit TctC